MSRVGAGFRLFREFVGFARENRAYWIVPFIILLGLCGFLVVAGQSAAPLLYALF